MANPFATAEGKRIELTNNQVKQIRALYKDVRHEFQNKIRILGNKTNISSQMRERYLKDFSKDLSADINYLNRQLENTITNNALKVATAVVEDSNKLNESMGFRGIFTNDYYIPHQAVESIITGKLYEGKWTLSKAIWSDNQKKLNDINEIVAKGMVANKGAYDIAKDLERYVNPQARKDWNWSKVYPGTSKKIDYNAQRLARTMLSHAYQESFVRSTKDNPFIESYRWLASGGDRMCDICAERDGKIFSKDELPLDHPNGMCTFEVVIEKSYDEIAKELRDWVDDKGDPELNEQIDGFANSLGYNVKDWTGNYIHNLANKELDLISINNKYTSFSSIRDAKSFEDKWNIPIKNISNEKSIANLDDAMVFMQNEYNLDLSQNIKSIKGEEKSNGNYKLEYVPFTKTLLVNHECINQEILPSDWSHDLDHAVQGQISKQEGKFNSLLGINRIGKEIVSETYSENGYQINPKTGLPFAKDVEETISKYAKDELLKHPSECLSEATRLICKNDIENRKVGKEKLEFARKLHEKEKEWLNKIK